jgi:hypothetical protein
MSPQRRQGGSPPRPWWALRRQPRQDDWTDFEAIYEPGLAVVVVGCQSIRVFPLQDGCYSLLIHASTRGHFVDIARIQGGELLFLTPFDIPNRRVKPYACGLPLVTSDSQRRFA